MAKDDVAKELASEAYERAQAALESAREALKQAHGKVEDSIDDAGRYLKRQWNERPVTVAATALGIGVLIGVLIGSRR